MIPKGRCTSCAHFHHNPNLDVPGAGVCFDPAKVIYSGQGTVANDTATTQAYNYCDNHLGVSKDDRKT